MNLQDMMADWMQRFPRLAQRFGQGPQMHPPGFHGPQMPPSQMPPVMTGGGMQRMPMGGLNPQDGGYDSSGINPNGMYTGGNQRPGLAGMFRRRQ